MKVLIVRGVLLSPHPPLRHLLQGTTSAHITVALLGRHARLLQINRSVEMVLVIAIVLAWNVEMGIMKIVGRRRVRHPILLLPERVSRAVACGARIIKESSAIVVLTGVGVPLKVLG